MSIQNAAVSANATHDAFLPATLLFLLASITPQSLAQEWTAYDAALDTLPAAQGWTLIDTSGPTPTVLAGELRQGPTTVPGYQLWTRDDVHLPGACALELEFELRIVNVTSGMCCGGCPLAGWQAVVRDDEAREYDVQITNAEVRLFATGCGTGGVSVATPQQTTDRHHRYRVVINALGAALFIDDEARLVVPRAAVGDPMNADTVGWGDWTAGGSNQSLLRFFRYRNGAVVAVHPRPALTCPGGGATFTVVPAGQGPFLFEWEWRERGQPDFRAVVPGPNAADGGAGLPPRFFTDAVNEPNLAIRDVTPGFDAEYRCVVTDLCGEVPSNPATLRVCVADVDDGSGTGTCDGGVTIDDLLYYLFIFEVGELRADVDDGSNTGTPDGGVTIDDLLYYLARFEAGC